MSIFNSMKFMYYYLKGVISFNSKNFTSALLNFEKAIPFKKKQGEELIYLYLGQTLLSLNTIEDSFFYLSKSYEIYDKKGWVVEDEEEQRLVKDSLSALKYLEENYNLKVDGIIYDPNIIKK